MCSPVREYEARGRRVSAGTSEICVVAEVALEVSHSVVRGELEDQPFPLHGRFVRDQQHLQASAQKFQARRLELCGYFTSRNLSF